ncbi:MAG: hypothetical protein AAF570_00840 [Bacteroidota bacterium]
MTHNWKGETKTFEKRTMDKEFSLGGPTVTGSGANDYWSLSFEMPNGTKYYRRNKQCNIQSSDINSGEAIHFNLEPITKGFSIEMPVSASCNDNYYDKD